MGKHDRTDRPNEDYGKHSRAHATGLWAVELIQRVIESGGAFGLAWKGEETDSNPERRREFPTARLPVIRDVDPEADDETEPISTNQYDGKWFQSEYFAWRPETLTG